VARDRGECRDCLRREELLEVAADEGDRDRLVDVDDTGERRQVGNARVARVQHAELVELPVVHAVGEEGARLLPPWSSGGEPVFDHPLAERFADDRPAVVDADLCA
jgi:hypothetical protein